MKDIIKTWVFRIVRLAIISFALFCVAVAWSKHPVGVPVVFSVTALVFVLFEWPYKLICELYMHMTKANYVFNIQPFKRKVMKFVRKSFRKLIDGGDAVVGANIYRHENRHLAQIEKIAGYVMSYHLAAAIWVLLYCLGLVWFGYTNHPLEVDARANE